MLEMIISRRQLIVFRGNGCCYFAEIVGGSVADIYGRDRSICIWCMYFAEMVNVYLAEMVFCGDSWCVCGRSIRQR